MQKLWAPWRINYVGVKKKQKGCVFCQAKKLSTHKASEILARSARRKAQGNPKSDRVIFKTAKSICLLNIYPYNNGHLMIAPLRHFSDILNATEAEILDMFKCLKKAKALLEKVLKPHGFNVGFNLGKSAGAGITGHLHLHIVPRWIGDTNFMPATCSTKVISQSLDQLAKLLKNAIK